MVDKPPPEADIAPPPDPLDDALTPSEQWYLDCLEQWCRQKRAAPTIRQLGQWIDRSVGPVYQAMKSLELKGLVVRSTKEAYHRRRAFVPKAFEGLL